MPEWLMREPTCHRGSRHALRPARLTPRGRPGGPALDRRAIRLDLLPDGGAPELVAAAERGQVRDRGSRGEHVEVFRDGKREELPSSGDLDPYRATDALNPQHPCS